jgi:hypothetical protein
VTRHDPTCAELVELSGTYLEGLMPEEFRETFEQHLLVCPPCVVHFNRLEMVRRSTCRSSSRRWRRMALAFAACCSLPSMSLRARSRAGRARPASILRRFLRGYFALSEGRVPSVQDGEYRELERHLERPVALLPLLA